MLEVEGGSPSTREVFSRDYYDDVISRLRIQFQSGENVIEDLCLARQRKLRYFVASSAEINQWIGDILSLTDDVTRKRLLFESYMLIVNDYSVVQYWEPLIILALDRKEELLKNSDQDTNSSLSFSLIESLDDIIRLGISKTALDYKDRHRIFQLELRMNMNQLVSTQYELRMKNLKIPHANLDESFQELSSFVSQNFSNEYEKRMVTANKIYSSTKRKQRYYENHELAIAETPENPQLWVDYLDNIGKYSSSDELSQLFQRSIAAVTSLTVPVWPLIWISYIYMIYENRDVLGSQLPKILINFVRTYPESSISYAEYVRNCELIEDFIVIRSRYIENDIMHRENYDQWKVLALAIVSFYYNNLSEIANKEMILKDLNSLVGYAIETNIDAYNVVEKITIPFIEELQPELAAQLYEKFVEQNLNKADTWLFMDKRERMGGSYASKYLERALDMAITLDSPELIVLEWLSNKVLSSSDNYCSAIARANKVMKEVSLKWINDRSDGSYENRSERDHREPSQQVSSNDPFVEPTRNREEFSVKVKNLPLQISKEELSDFFQDCGPVVEVHLIKTNEESSEATLEFSNERQLFAAITKDKKFIEGRQIEVKKAERTTIWVTNYPPYMTQEEIRDVFSEIGPVVSIRFPSLKFNQNRRFCYIEFTGSESASKAVNKFNGYKIDEFKLVVKISRPEERTTRNVGPVDQGREIFVQNLSFDKVTPQILEQHFSKYGQIEKVNVPRGKGNNLNSGYGFVIFQAQSSANAALGENGKEIEGRKVNVSISRSKGQLEPVSKTFKDTTVKLLDVDDTVTPEVIKRFASTVGPVKSVNILTDHVAVEFENASDSGRAVLQLNGTILGKGKIQVVSGVSQTKKRLFMPPHLARKRPAGGSGSSNKRSKIE